MAPPGFAAWARAQCTLQPYEAWQKFRQWVDEANPRFQFTVARNLVVAGAISAGDRAYAALVREEARGRLRHLLGPGTILCLPTTPFPAPKCGLSIIGLRGSDATLVAVAKALG
jgi:amidase